MTQIAKELVLLCLFLEADFTQAYCSCIDWQKVVSLGNV